MKKFENLGKMLGKPEQKKITGGAIHKLWCWTVADCGDPAGIVLAGTYPSYQDCQAAFYGICQNPPYCACYCNWDPWPTPCYV